MSNSPALRSKEKEPQKSNPLLSDQTKARFLAKPLSEDSFKLSVTYSHKCGVPERQNRDYGLCPCAEKPRWFSSDYSDAFVLGIISMTHRDKIVLASPRDNSPSFA